jgi:hypothetical protein
MQGGLQAAAREITYQRHLTTFCGGPETLVMRAMRRGSDRRRNIYCQPHFSSTNAVNLPLNRLHVRHNNTAVLPRGIARPELLLKTGLLLLSATAKRTTVGDIVVCFFPLQMVESIPPINVSGHHFSLQTFPTGGNIFACLAFVHRAPARLLRQYRDVSYS